VAELIPVQRITVRRDFCSLAECSWVLLDHSCYCDSSVETTLCTRCCLYWPSST